MSRNAVTAVIVTALPGAVGLIALFPKNDKTFAVVFKDAKQLEPGMMQGV